MATLNTIAVAKKLQPQKSPDGFVEVTYGEVTAYSAGGSGTPPSCTVHVDGFSVDRTNCIWPSNSYTPAVNDTVICLLIGVDTIILGTVPSA